LRLFTQKIVVLRHTSFIVSPRFLDAGALHFRQLSSLARAGTQKTLILRSWKLSTCYSPGAASSVLRPTPFPPLPSCNALPLPAYTTADVALKWQPSDATTLALHGHNIFNRHYYSTVYYNEKQWFVGESRRVLFTIDHRF